MAEPIVADFWPVADTPLEEEVLRDALRRSREDPNGTFAVHYHLSNLKPGNRQPNFIRIVLRAFETLAANFDARPYRLSNADVVLLCRDVPIEEIDEPTARIRGLFGEDPLTFGEAGTPEDRFATWYDLSEPDDFTVLYSTVSEMLALAEEKRRRAVDTLAGSPTRRMEGEPLDPRNVAAIKQRLEHVDIAELIHHQVALDILAKDGGARIFNETTVSMAELQRRVAPGVNLYANPWLFLYLTQTLDRLLLAFLAHRGQPGKRGPVSLNLNLGTVQSREFRKFQKALGPAAKGTVIEIQMVDALADLNTYFAVREFLQSAGFKVLLDGVSPLATHYLDPGRFGADLVKIIWGRELPAFSEGKKLEETRAFVNAVGRDAIVLARVETEAAIKWGLNLGIHKFQGFFVDRLVDAMRAKGTIC